MTMSLLTTLDRCLSILFYMILISMAFHIAGNNDSLMNPSTMHSVFLLILLSIDSDLDNIIR